ncbi:axin interactor, dorsalization-associated protein-like [Aduncisulcus paluster]|uniref:Axin interactor, dorsalization-associated protein-like n=1 Tax=Aduncisulcus paluster TaxID=2918883 RepID=A0ABQ5KWT8_9EUKA|nr:axin interactor, dorsalization-associated protein-like [Aduncisulcus paluster]
MQRLVEIGSVRRRWIQTLEAALDADKWGQILEAQEEYKLLERLISKRVKTWRLSLRLQSPLKKVCIVLMLRISVLEGESDVDISIRHIKMLLPVLKVAFEPEQPPFPINLKQYAKQIAALGTDFSSDAPGESSAPFDGKIMKSGTLLPPPPPRVDGGVHMTFRILKMVLPDAEKFHSPHITVTVVDPQGKEVETPQTTPPADRRERGIVHFDNVCHIQTPVNHLLDGTTVFFEFKHFKIDRGRESVKCYALYQLHEVREGELSLPVYKKPTDFTQKKLKPYTAATMTISVGLTME